MIDTQFIEAIRVAQPSRIFDLRFAPRFDLGSLNRNSAFALFDEVKATYIDAAAHFMLGNPRQTAVDQLRDELATADPHRPVLFLFGSAKTSLLAEGEILNLLSEVGKPTSDLVLVPERS
ncbi:MAG: hypothetical protein SFV51_17365 [Bryobacteraceae bacterium]|nr:hypothetical protein [Bryobacteraceae bacterium]